METWLVISQVTTTGLQVEVTQYLGGNYQEYTGAHGMVESEFSDRNSAELYVMELIHKDKDNLTYFTGSYSAGRRLEISKN